MLELLLAHTTNWLTYNIVNVFHEYHQNQKGLQQNPLYKPPSDTGMHAPMPLHALIEFSVLEMDCMGLVPPL